MEERKVKRENGRKGPWDSYVRKRGPWFSVSHITFDSPSLSCFFPKMVRRSWLTSDRLLRPSRMGSPTTLLAVVLGLVSESV